LSATAKRAHARPSMKPRQGMPWLRGEATGLPGLRTANLQRDHRSRLESWPFRAMEDVNMSFPMLRRHWPPASKNASVICCGLPRAASIQAAKTWPPETGRAGRDGRDGSAARACSWWRPVKPRTRVGWDFLSHSGARVS